MPRVSCALDYEALLRVGDVVRVEIEGLGALENEIVAEPETTSIL
jgi:2-keto-4-pentenoate hydratase/2-oxohepta-3-ene-1,7-dioic acid hydratase in catechol pathway